MSTRLVVATGNPGKLVEIQRFFAGVDVLLVTLTEVLGYLPKVDEVGSTFRANAEIKAVSACAETGLWVLADDSGLEVDRLGGRPGVRSARYAGEAASDEDNNRRLLRQLDGVPETERTARFRAALTLARPGARLLTVDAPSVEGIILGEPRGSGGFGYDPLFSVPSLGGLTFAELDPEQKDGVSHRGRALRKLRVLLEDLLPGRPAQQGGA